MGASQVPGSQVGVPRVKLLLFGQAFTGKSNLVSMYKDSEFIQEYHQTLGCAMHNFSVTVEGERVTLLVLDALSDNDYSIECRLKSIGNADIVAIVFDLNNESSWDDVDVKFGYLQQYGYRNNKVLLVGAKSDLTCNVKREDIEKFIEVSAPYGIEYVETSTKLNVKISEVFELAAKFGVDHRLLHWKRARVLLFVHKYAPTGAELEGLSWVTLCEAIPNVFARKPSKKAMPIARLSQEFLSQLLPYI